VYLDFASATPVRAEVFAKMRPYFSQLWGNPGAVHKEGVIAHQAVSDARKRVAQVLRVRPQDITFTSGGTESNNLALMGVIEKLRLAGRAYQDMELITTRIEHPSILEVAEHLKRLGVTVSYVPVLETGRLDMDAFGHMLKPTTTVVSLAYVNSEIGVVQDVKKIARIVRAMNAKHGGSILFHIDASQAPLWLPCGMDTLGVDLMTLDAGKCYGPKGVGVLVHRRAAELAQVVFGGGQERGLRSGTETVPLIVGCAHAIEIAQTGYVSRVKRVHALQEHFFALLQKMIPGAVVNGDREHRVSNNVHISIPGYDSEYAVLWLDARGIATSTKSACGVGDSNGSAVVRELTRDEARARSTIRFTLGEETKRGDIARAVLALQDFMALMKREVRS
jgi:cysteine desulfurase